MAYCFKHKREMTGFLTAFCPDCDLEEASPQPKVAEPEQVVFYARPRTLLAVSRGYPTTLHIWGELSKVAEVAHRPPGGGYRITDIIPFRGIIPTKDKRTLELLNKSNGNWLTVFGRWINTRGGKQLLKLESVLPGHITELPNGQKVQPTF